MPRITRRGLLAATIVSPLASTRAFAADPIRIGFVESLTGPFSVNGNGTAFAVDASVSAINAQGGLLGRPLVLVTRDSASDPSKALAVTNALLFNDTIDVLMGPGGSGEAFHMMDVVAGAKKLFITPTQADPLIDPVKRPLTFRGMPTLGAVAARTVRFTNESLKRKKVVIFADSTGYGTNVADLLKAEYAKSGVTPLAVTLIKVNQADVTPEMSKAEAAGADLIQVWTSATGLMARLLNARGEIGWNVPVAGHTNLIGKEVAGLVDKPDYLNDVYAITYSNSVYDDTGKLPSKSQAFVDLVAKTIEKGAGGAPLFALIIGAGMVEIPRLFAQAKGTLFDQKFWLPVAVALATAFLLELFYSRTLLGKSFPAVAEDEFAARARGISATKVRVLSYMLAGAAGALSGMAAGQLTFADASLGARLGLGGFLALAVVGIGSSKGCLIGGMFTGLLNSFTTEQFGAQYQNAVSLSVLSLVLVIRPLGLFGVRNTRAV